MANPKIISADLIGYDFNTFSPPNEDTSYPLANLNNYYLSEQWRSNTTATQSLYVDFGVPKECTSIVLDNHNFDTLGVTATLTLQACNTASFSANVTSFTASLVNPGTQVVQFASTTARFWRIAFTGTLPEVPKLGQIFIEKYLEFTTPYDFGYKTGNSRYETYEVSSLSGRTRSSQLYGGRDVYELKFELQDATLRSSYLSFQEKSKGRARPFYFIDTDGTTIYRFKQDKDYAPIIGRAPTKNNIEALTFRTETAS